MEKISIVKRRNDTNNNHQFYCPGPDPMSDVSPASITSAVKRRLLQAPYAEITPEENPPNAMEVTLSPELTAHLRSAKGLEQFFQQGIVGVDIKVEKEKEDQVVFRFHFSQVQNPKMLTPAEVCEMMRISRSFLGKIVKHGSIKSYKIGRLRRFLVTHVLDYLSNEDKIPQ